MSENDQNSPPNRRRHSGGFPFALVILGILIILLGAVWFLRPGSKPTSQPEPAPAPAQQAEVQEPVPVPAEPVATPPDDTVPAPVPTEAADTAPQVATPMEEFVPGMVFPAEPERIAPLCSLVADRLHAFFRHVDQQDYTDRFQLKEPSQDYFTALAYRLLDNPPVVSRESDDLYTILRNMAHFFRIIGKDNIILLKTILDRERDKIEDVAAELYFWSTHSSCTSDQFSFAPTLEKMYEYAGFFLNTMGGRSYLFRRDSRSRLLVNYYSILLVDRANSMGVNRHGIDISLVIPQLMQEIETSNQLIYKENYLDRLADLLEKYPAPETEE